MSDNILYYLIAMEWLYGSVNNENFSMHAWSGGRRGSTTPGVAEHSILSYDVFRKEKPGVNGGPLPPGLYICHYTTNGPGGKSIRLEPTMAALFQVDQGLTVHWYHRGGFYIHGRGPIGSEGCIVPENEADRQRLNNAIKSCAETVMLRVQDPGMPLPAGIQSRYQYAWLNFP
jgi:hypothetical protein